MDAIVLQSMLSTFIGQIQSGLQYQVQAGIQSKISVAQEHMLRQAQEAAHRLGAEALQREALARREMDALRSDIANRRLRSKRSERRTRPRRAGSSQEVGNQVPKCPSVVISLTSTGHSPAPIIVTSPPPGLRGPGSYPGGCPTKWKPGDPRHSGSRDADQVDGSRCP